MPDLIQALRHQVEAGDVVLVVDLCLLAVATLLTMASLRGPLEGLAWARTTGRACAQLGMVLGLEQAYELTRGQIPLRTDVAFLNAYRLLDLEWRHGFFIESRIERFFLQFTAVMNAVDVFYVVGHVGVTIGVLVWLYFWRRDQYPLVRNLLMITTGIALIVFYVYPTAPPRMLGNYSFVDPLELHNLVGPGGAQPDSYTYNPYAAFPSLHVAYAIVSSFGLFVATRRLWIRMLAVLYPFAMGAVVVISGNHFLLDIVGAAITVGLAGVILALLHRTRGMLLRTLAPYLLAVVPGAPPSGQSP
jgi:membrane-associated phospholipid phosphatase